MEWTAELNKKTIKLQMPDKVMDDVPFNVTVDGKNQSVRWQKTTKTLFLRDVLDNGLVLEKPILIRNLEVDRPSGEAKSTAHVEITAHGTGEILATVSRYVFGQENRDKAAQSKGAVIRSPITGKVLKVYFKEGDKIESGQVIAIVEAMKMENKIIAPTSGILGKINIAEGGTVSTGVQITAISQES